MEIGFKFAGNPLGEAYDSGKSDFAIALDSNLTQYLKSVHARATAYLISGEHSIHLSGRPAIFGVDDNTQVDIELDVRSDSKSRLILDCLTIAFSKPLHLKNIFTTIDEMSELVADLPSLIKPKIDIDVNEIISKNELLSKASSFVESKAGSYLGKISGHPAWKFIKEAAERGRLSENIEKSKEISKEWFGKSIEKAEAFLDSAFDGVLLSKLEISAVEKEDGPKLVLFVTGEVVINERIRRGFEHMQGSLLPGMDAHLSNVLNQFYVDRDQGSNLSRTILNMIQEVEATADARIDVPSIPMSLFNNQGYQIQLGVNMNQKYALSSVCHISRKDESFLFNILIGSPDASSKSQHQIQISMQADVEAMVSAGQALVLGGWQMSVLGHGDDIMGTVEILDDIQFTTDSVAIQAQNQYLNVDMNVEMMVDFQKIQGYLEWGLDIASRELHVHRCQLHMNGNSALTDHQVMSLAHMSAAFSQLQGEFEIDLQRQEMSCIQLNVHSDIAFESHTDIHVLPLPEFELFQPSAEADIRGQLNADISIHAGNAENELLVVDLDNSKIHLACEYIKFVRDRLNIQTVSPVNADLCIKHAAYTTTGISECLIQVGYFCEKSPVLMVGDQVTDILPDSLVATNNQIDCSVSNNGVVHFENGSGFYDEHFFNALLFPLRETDKILEMLENKSLGLCLGNIARLAIFPIWPGTEKFFDRLFRWINRCREFNIFSTQKLIHIPNLALAISLFFFDNDSAVDEIMPSLERINRAEGIDRYKIEELFDRAFPEQDFDNTGRILKWINKLFKPVTYEPPEVTHLQALCDDPQYIGTISPLPTANQVYDGDWSDKTLVSQIYRYASGFSADQLAWMIENHTNDFTPEHLDKLKKLMGIKRRVLELEPREGTFFLQDYNIGIFLDNLIQVETACLEEIQNESGQADNPVTDCFRSWLAPVDLARLISAGISSRYHGLFVQLNQAKLWEILQKRDSTYVTAVFYEIGQHNVRTLAAMLMSFLAQDQSMLTHPVDRVACLSEMLHIPLPKTEDFAPWNRQGTQSYMDAIFKAADIIQKSNQPYNAALLRMQTYRYEMPDLPVNEISPRAKLPVVTESSDFSVIYKQFVEKVIDTDQAASVILKDYLSQPSEALYQKAQQLYLDLIGVAKRLIESRKDSFELPEFKTFWNRLYEALRIASVEEDLKFDHDEVRGWFGCRLQMNDAQIQDLSRVELIRHVIGLIYAYPEDQACLSADPLVWFVPRVAHQPMDLSVITAMGVITNGRAGHELESVFDRLERDFQIHLVRSDTGLVKSLDYNARQICSVIEQMSGPYVMIGYSQGCANMMRAESLLFAGTPKMRSSLDNLVSRHFLCSAFNGSVHAVCGVEKYRTALIEGENILKNISIHYSKYLTALTLKVLQRTLDAPTFNMSMSSFESLSHHGLQQLSRDAQYKPGIPILETQGHTVSHIPEALLMMTSHFYKQSNTPNDSQVGVDCAHGYTVYNHNRSVDVLLDASVSSKTLNIHHWSPLKEEIQLVQTQLDYEQYVYRGPKSMFVLPWIESLIMLGFVHAKSL